MVTLSWTQVNKILRTEVNQFLRNEGAGIEEYSGIRPERHWNELTNPETKGFHFHTNYPGQRWFWLVCLFFFGCFCCCCCCFLAVYYSLCCLLSYVQWVLWFWSCIMELVIFLNIICSHDFIRGYPFFFVVVVQLCRRRTIRNKQQYAEQTIKYIEQREL